MAGARISLSLEKLDDPRVGRLSDQAFRVWIVALGLARKSAEPGVVGSAEDLAWVLRWMEEDVLIALRSLDGLIEDQDGRLVIVDWRQYIGPSSSTDRVRRHRGTLPPPVPENIVVFHREPPVNPNAPGTSVVTLAKPTSTAPPDGNVSSQVDWKPFYEDVVALWGGQIWYTAQGGVLPWVEAMRGMAERFHLGVADARRLLHQWHESREFQYALSPAKAPPKWGRWVSQQAEFAHAVQR